MPVASSANVQLSTADQIQAIINQISALQAQLNVLTNGNDTTVTTTTPPPATPPAGSNTTTIRGTITVTKTVNSKPGQSCSTTYADNKTFKTGDHFCLQFHVVNRDESLPHGYLDDQSKNYDIISIDTPSDSHFNYLSGNNQWHSHWNQTDDVYVEGTVPNGTPDGTYTITNHIAAKKCTSHDFLGTDCGGWTDGYVSAQITVSNGASKPTVTVTATPAATAGQWTVSWTSTNTTGCTWNGDNSTVGTSGSKTVSPTSDTYYEVTCYGANQTVAQNQALVTTGSTVSNPNAITAPSVSLSASPLSSTIGQTVTLTHTVSNATSCDHIGFDMQSINDTSSTTVSPTQTTTYTLTCKNSAGSTSKSVTVTVTSNASDPVVPSVSLTANPTSITAGQSATLTWSSTAMSCTGTGFDTQSKPSGSVSVSPTQTTSYAVNCSNTGGPTITKSATVTVNADIGGTVTSTAPNAWGVPYNQTSSTALSSSEKTVDYTYTNNACGTLMTSYTAPGSVFVGNGPVYASASSACSPSLPDLSSFRTYSCSNANVGGVIEGSATFAFKCLPNQTSAVYSSIEALIQEISAGIKSLQ